MCYAKPRNTFELCFCIIVGAIYTVLRIGTNTKSDERFLIHNIFVGLGSQPQTVLAALPCKWLSRGAVNAKKSHYSLHDSLVEHRRTFGVSASGVVDDVHVTSEAAHGMQVFRQYETRGRGSCEEISARLFAKRTLSRERDYGEFDVDSTRFTASTVIECGSATADQRRGKPHLLSEYARHLVLVLLRRCIGTP